MNKIVKKAISVIISVCLVFSTFAISTTMPTPAQTQAEKKAELQAKLEETDKKLKELGKEKKDAQAYLDVIDEKLDTLKKQYNIAKNEVEETENRVNQTQRNIEKNTQTLANIEVEMEDMKKDSVELEKEYKEIQDKYFKRMRAIYVSGQTESILSLLVSANGIQSFLTRMEMVSAIAKNDSQLMKNITSKIQEIKTNRISLESKKEELNKTQKALKSDSESLKIQQVSLAEREQEAKEKKSAMEKQQTEANKVLQKINNETKEYSELHDMTQEEIDKIDNEIAEAIKKYNKKKKTTTTTTTKPATTVAGETTTTTTQPAEQNNTGFINMTYPCPAYTKITCGFYGYSGHNGCDFSTGGTVGNRIVAVDSGTVIISRDITCNRSTCSKSNHGGGYCSYGRYIVIAHDNPTRNGDNVYTLYAHNSERYVEAGEHVEKGQQISASGSTGNSTGPHLHFEVRLGNGSYSDAVDPSIYLP